MEHHSVVLWTIPSVHFFQGHSPDVPFRNSNKNNVCLQWNIEELFANFVTANGPACKCRQILIFKTSRSKIDSGHHIRLIPSPPPPWMQRWQRRHWCPPRWRCLRRLRSLRHRPSGSTAASPRWPGSWGRPETREPLKVGIIHLTLKPSYILLYFM